MKRGEITSIEEIHLLTNNGRDVFIRELGNIPHKTINSPLRTDKSPSFSLYCGDNGIWRYKDFSTGDSGSYIDFIKVKYNLSFQDALKYIKNELKVENKGVIKDYNRKEFVKRETIIEFSDYPFEGKHREYWDKYELDEQFLRENDVFAVKFWGINGKIRKVQNSRAVFAYWAKDIDKVKILQVGKDVKKEEKWFNNVNNNYIWLKPTEKCEQLWINKSLKDALVMKKHFNKCSCAVQNENYKHLEVNMPELLSLSNEIVLNYGADKMGVDNCTIIQKKYNTKYWNTPKYLLKYGVQDISDLIAEFGIEIAKKELKIKGYL